MTIRLARLSILCVAGLLIPDRVQAQAEHGWVSGNAVATVPATGSFVQNLAVPYRFETFRGSFGYTFQTRASFDIDGGVVLARHFGVGIAISRLSSSHPTAVAISVPDILRFNALAAATGVTIDSLPHTETAIHFEGAYIVNVRHGSLRLFGGPSMMRVTQEVISDVQYSEVTTGMSHIIALTGESHGRATDTSLGFNVGADGGIYINRHFGVGAMLRYSRASATIKNVLQSRDEELRVGGLTAGAGVRIRF